MVGSLSNRQPHETQLLISKSFSNAPFYPRWVKLYWIILLVTCRQLQASCQNTLRRIRHQSRKHIRAVHRPQSHQQPCGQKAESVLWILKEFSSRIYNPVENKNGGVRRQGERRRCRKHKIWFDNITQLQNLCNPRLIPINSVHDTVYAILSRSILHTHLYAPLTLPVCKRPCGYPRNSQLQYVHKITIPGPCHPNFSPHLHQKIKVINAQRKRKSNTQSNKPTNPIKLHLIIIIQPLRPHSPFHPFPSCVWVCLLSTKAATSFALNAPHLDDILAGLIKLRFDAAGNFIAVPKGFSLPNVVHDHGVDLLELLNVEAIGALRKAVVEISHCLWGGGEVGEWRCGEGE